MMKSKFQLVEFLNNNYKNLNIQKGMYGVIINKENANFTVMVLNNNNWGDYAVISVKEKDIKNVNESLPAKIIEELKEFVAKDKYNEKNSLKAPVFNQYDQVELLVEDEKYLKYGIHKGELGVVIETQIIKNKILVDFSGIDSNGKYYGDCILVNIKDLKLK